MSRSRIAAVSAVVTICAFLPWPSAGSAGSVSEQEVVRIQVIDYPRPVSEAVRQIEKYFGWVVTYEDTRYFHPDDIVDVTEQVSRVAKPSKRVLAMRPGSIDVLYVSQPTVRVETQVHEVLQEVLRASSAAGNTGEFRIEWASGGYHVVPTAMKGRSGLMERYQSPLDSRITLPYREENGLEAMDRMARAISTSAGVTVRPGIMPMNLLVRKRVSAVAQGDRARNVLWRTLQSMRPRLSWQLLCGAGHESTCALNIHVVPDKTEGVL